MVTKEESRWQAPEQGTLKINVDAAFLEQAGCGSTGLVVRDSEGNLIRAQALWYRFASSAQTMELYAIRDGIQLARDMGYSQICIESDAQQVVRMCNSKLSERAANAAVCHEIEELLGGFMRCGLVFVHREANEAAHRCAKQATEGRRRCLWINYMPHFLASCIQLPCNPP